MGGLVWTMWLGFPWAAPHILGPKPPAYIIVAQVRDRRGVLNHLCNDPSVFQLGVVGELDFDDHDVPRLAQ